jgi:hypothetical protein
VTDTTRISTTTLSSASRYSCHGEVPTGGHGHPVVRADGHDIAVPRSLMLLRGSRPP